eukprot:CAMPEP_0184861668 /NCGR_PEP_ID=MMETSP0580-20130426/6298_1 /TAXON_ID=1118495 /ORGANISM="Dactyliosolen fragilissimus" /LENGTH=368 /DNA_ID=CAMNT_0027359239 /DNA_START=71 /DNA_END=1174 /DNA_ORIENTATION=+
MSKTKPERGSNDDFIQEFDEKIEADLKLDVIGRRRKVCLTLAIIFSFIVFVIYASFVFRKESKLEIFIPGDIPMKANNIESSGYDLQTKDPYESTSNITSYHSESTNSNNNSEIQNENYLKQTVTDPAHSGDNVTLQDGRMFQVVGETIWHDKSHFTQGLTYLRGALYESSGMYGQSTVCKISPITGKSEICLEIGDKYFAEGLQAYGEEGKEKLIQLTWKQHIGWIRDAKTLEVISEFVFNTTHNEGWGICWDEENDEFIVSDGSPYLHFWDVKTLKEKKRLMVTRQDGRPANELNELEFVNGKVLANIWYEDAIVVIDPVTGICEKEYDFSTIWPKKNRKKNGANVLNGISVSGKDGELFITGKNW